MATGYTYPVHDGEITTFKEFASKCAHAFGALVEFRDCPSTNGLPEPSGPSNYHAEMYAKEKKEFSEKCNWTDVQWRIACAEANKKGIDDANRRLAEKEVCKQRYESMLAKVKGWTPPTEDHVGLKEFMIAQLQESIEWDTGYTITYTPLTVEEYKENILGLHVRNIDYHKNEMDKEIQRTEERKKWVSQLRDSLDRYGQ
jgi:hypothetical protein